MDHIFDLELAFDWPLRYFWEQVLKEDENILE